jgi:hypothetical protein
MTNSQIDMILSLKQCTFVPGSFQKRFVQSMLSHAAFRPGTPLTDRQGRYLAELFHKYRKQIGTLEHNLHCELCNRALDAIEEPG